MPNNENKGIIAWFTTNPVAANLLLFSVIVMGILSLSQLRKETFPSLEASTITVSTTYNSGDPIQSEEGISLKIEEALEGIDGIKRVTSLSNASGSRVTIEKESGYDLETLYSDIKDEVDALNGLPTEADKPVVLKEKRARPHVIYVQLFGDADRQLLQKTSQNLKSDLLQDPNISEVNIIYELDPYLSIEINKDKLKAYGLTLSDVENTINKESGVAMSSSLRNGEKTVRIKGVEQSYTVDEFGELAILSNEKGVVLRLKDIAEISNGFDEDDFALTRYNGKNAMTLEVVMGENSDIEKSAIAANKVAEKWKTNNYLPSNIEITTWKDSSETIKDRLSLLVNNALTGVIMVFVVLALFLNITVAFWVAAGLPFVFFGTLFLMTGSFADLTINQMTTFGFIMALGIVVDDAVVIGESIYSTRQKEGDSIRSTIKGANKVAIPTVFGVLTTVASFMALSNIEGGLGQIFAQFGTVVTICLLLSMVESKLILPSHLAHVNTHKKESKYNIIAKIQKGSDAALMVFNNKVYEPLIDFCLKAKTFVILAFIAVIIAIGSMPMNGTIRISFFPSIPGEQVRASLSMLQDVSYNQTADNLLLLERTAMEADRQLLEKYNSIKETEINNILVTSNSDTSGSIEVVFDSEPDYTAKEFADLWSSLTPRLEGSKKLNIRSTRAMVDNFNIELKSINSEDVYDAGESIRSYLEKVNGVSGIDDNLTQVVPQYRIELNEQGRALGLTPTTITSQVFKMFGGGTAQRFQKNNEEVTVSVRYPKEDRQTLMDILNADIKLTNGSSVPLSSVANVVSTYQQSSLTRIDNKKAIYVTASVDKDVISSNELVEKVKSDVVYQLQVKYPHLDVKFSGEAEQQKEAIDSIEIMAFAAFIAIYALLAIPLKSYVQPLLIMTSIPFGIIGAILGHYIAGLSLSILSLFGILALSGVVVNDSLLLVSKYNDLVKEKSLSTHDAIIESCKSRLRAILLTSFTTFAGLLPILSETSMQSQFLKPAAASLGYGILFATLITLVLIPVLLMIQENVKNFLSESKNKVGSLIKS